MADGDSMAQAVVVILLLGLAVPALGTAHTYAGTPFEYEETLTVDYTDDSSVSENATVENYGTDPTLTNSSGTELVAGEDYDWNATSGNVTWFNTSNTTSGEAVDIEYQAYQRTDETAAAWTILVPLMSLFGLFGFVAAVRALWQVSAEVWEL